MCRPIKLYSVNKLKSLLQTILLQSTVQRKVIDQIKKGSMFYFDILIKRVGHLSVKNIFVQFKYTVGPTFKV